MYYLIRKWHDLTGSRRRRDGEVLAILYVREVMDLGSESWIDIRSPLVKIIEKDLNIVDKWYFHQITQAEYETYRDLHGFHVIKK